MSKKKQPEMEIPAKKSDQVTGLQGYKDGE